MSARPTCQTCDAYERDRCHALPPTVVIDPSKSHGVPSHVKYEQPQVRPFDWCRLWVEKEETR